MSFWCSTSYFRTYSGATGRGPTLALARVPGVLSLFLGFLFVFFCFAHIFFGCPWISKSVVLNDRSYDNSATVRQDSLIECVEVKLQLHETQIELLKARKGQASDPIQPALRIIKERHSEKKEETSDGKCQTHTVQTEVISAPSSASAPVGASASVSTPRPLSPFSPPFVEQKKQ